MRAAVYIRMSTADQKDSPERQWSQVRPHCVRLAYEVVGRYEDHGLKGWDDTRPEFLRLLADAKAGRFDVIVVDEFSRLSRQDALEFSATVALPLRDAGVSVESVAEGRQDWGDLVGLIQLQITQSKASQESVTLGRRTATGLARLAASGKVFHGRPPYGLKYVKDADGNRLGYAPGDPAEVRAVRFAFEAYAARDASIASLVADLGRLGHKPPGGARWGRVRVARMLRHQAYAGDYVWGKYPQGRYYRYAGGAVRASAKGESTSGVAPAADRVVVADAHEALVPRALFDLVQRLLTANRKRPSRGRKARAYPFAGLLFCHHCGGAMHGTTIAGRPHYRCGTWTATAGCAPRTVREAALLARLAATVRATLMTAESLAAMRRRFADRQPARDAADRAAGLQKAADAAAARIARAEDNLLELNRENLKKAQETLRKMRADWRAVSDEAAALRAVPDAPDTFDAVLARMDGFLAGEPGADPVAYRVLVRALFARIELRFGVVRHPTLTRYPLLDLRVEAVGWAPTVLTPCCPTPLQDCTCFRPPVRAAKTLPNPEKTGRRAGPGGKPRPRVS